MSASPNTIEIPLTLRISKQTQQTLIERAAANGTDLGEYVSVLVEQTTATPLSLEKISGDVYRRFLDSGTTDEQLSAELERAKHEARAERRKRQVS